MAEKIEKNEEKKISFFRKLFYSITKFEKYPEMAVEGISSAFKYLAIVMLIFSIIVSVGYVYQLREIITSPEFSNNISNLEIDETIKQEVLDYIAENGTISLYGIFFVIMTLYVFIFYSISVLVDTLLIAILGNITLLFTKLKLKFSAVYTMSIYALTLSIFLNAIYITINSITGFKMDYFPIMYTSIAYVYLVAVLLIIKSDFIKKQAELMKIMQEQEKVRQEMKEKEEQKQEDENKEHKETDKKEKDKKEKKEEESKTDAEPDGSEA